MLGGKMIQMPVVIPLVEVVLWMNYWSLCAMVATHYILKSSVWLIWEWQWWVDLEIKKISKELAGKRVYRLLAHPSVMLILLDDSLALRNRRNKLSAFVSFSQILTPRWSSKYWDLLLCHVTNSSLCSGGSRIVHCGLIPSENWLEAERAETR